MRTHGSWTRLRTRRVLAGAAFSALLVAGCATVTVRKVPTPSQYMEWSDHMQRKADDMEGVRYYMPRPFVNVFESFPIRTDIYLVQGVVSPDGAYVLLTDVVPEGHFVKDSPQTMPFPLRTAADPEKYKIPFSYIQQNAVDPERAADREYALKAATEPAPGSNDPTAHSAGGSGSPLPGEGVGRYVAREALLRILSGINGTDVSSSGLTGESLSGILRSFFDHQRELAKLPKERTPLVPGIGAGEPTGLDEFKVRNDNSLFAHQPLRGNFDIVYLPDFEEQYVVSSFAGLGNAKVALNLGQGWSLQGMDSLADNREINRRIFDLIDFAVQIGKTAALGAGGFTLPASPTAHSAGSGATVIPPQQELKTEECKAGTPVTLKFVVIHYAAKGMYPVLKPRELQQRYWAFDRRFGYRYGRHYCALDLFHAFPQRTPASLVGLDFSPLPPVVRDGAMDDFLPPGAEFEIEGAEGTGAAAGSKIERDRLTGHPLNLLSGQSTIPVYPYQYISFNTFRYVAIEAIRPTTDQRGPFAHVYSATGTDEQRGLVREEAGKPGGTPGPSPNDGTAASRLQDELAAAAAQPLELGNGGGSFTYKDVRVTSEDGKLKVRAMAADIPDRDPKPARSALEKAFREHVKAKATAATLGQIQDEHIALDVPDNLLGSVADD